MTTVYEATDVEIKQFAVYSCSPIEALISAYESSRGNNNTWTYKQEKDYPIIKHMGRTGILGRFMVAI